MTVRLTHAQAEVLKQVREAGALGLRNGLANSRVLEALQRQGLIEYRPSWRYFLTPKGESFR